MWHTVEKKEQHTTAYEINYISDLIEKYLRIFIIGTFTELKEIKVWLRVKKGMKTMYQILENINKMIEIL